MTYPKAITLETIRRTGINDLPALYRELHARATATENVFISLASLKQLQGRLDGIRKSDPDRRLLLYGVPFVVKDNIDALPFQTTNACPSAAYAPQRSAPVVEHLEAAGAIIMGKSNMDQFATGLVGTRSPYGIVRNVCNDKYVAGGSSSGSAAALAHGVAAFALGTDTAGSGRVPAAMHGLVGLKPTKGVLSTTGVLPACASLDCVSIFANSVLDAAAVYAITAPYYDTDNPFTRRVPDRRGVTQVDLSTSFELPRKGRFTFGVPNGPHLDFDSDVDAKINFSHAVRALESIGGRRVDIDFDPFAKVGAMLYESAFVAERFAAVGAFIKAHIEKKPEDFNEIVASIILPGERWSAHHVFTAQRTLRSLCKVAMRDVWPFIDFLLVPSIPRPVRLDEALQDPIKKNSLLGRYTNFVNLMDYCAMAVPTPPGAEEKTDVPRGCTIIAPAFNDREIIALAHAFEQHCRLLRSS